MNHWELVQEQAYKNEGTIYASLVRGHKYKIDAISERNIIIERLTIGGPAVFGKSAVNTAAERVKRLKRVPKALSASGAIRQATLVLLHPCIEWDSSHKELYWVKKAVPSLIATKTFIAKASNDDLEKIQAWINRRKNQDKFRKAILKLYGNKCAVSGTKIIATLIAAHISDHARDGNNSNDNGILLRADIHSLFDRGLLRINPDSLKIHLHETITDSEYTMLTKRDQIFLPIDGSMPNKRYLQEKWKMPTKL